jgi:hypothetical protein
MGKKVDVTIFVGDTWQQEYLWKDKTTGAPISLTGWTAELELFNEDGVRIDLLTSAGGDITLTTATGSIVVEMAKTATALLTPQTGSYRLHMDHTASGLRERLAWGAAAIVA